MEWNPSHQLAHEVITERIVDRLISDQLVDDASAVALREAIISGEASGDTWIELASRPSPSEAEVPQ